MRYSNLKWNTHPRQHRPYKELHTSTKNRQFSFGLSSFLPLQTPLLSSLSTYFPFFFSFSMKTHLLLFLRFSFFNVSCVFGLFFSSSVCLYSIITVVSTYCAKERPPLFLPSLSGRVSPCLMWHRQSKPLESSRAEIKRQGWSVRDKEDSGCDKHRENLHVTWQGPSALRTWFLLLLKV